LAVHNKFLDNKILLFYLISSTINYDRLKKDFIQLRKGGMARHRFRIDRQQSGDEVEQSGDVEEKER
jgi:hypothetical protein